MESERAPGKEENNLVEIQPITSNLITTVAIGYWEIVIGTLTARKGIEMARVPAKEENTIFEYNH